MRGLQLYYSSNTKIPVLFLVPGSRSLSWLRPGLLDDLDQGPGTLPIFLDWRYLLPSLGSRDLGLYQHLIYISYRSVGDYSLSKNISSVNPISPSYYSGGTGFSLSNCRMKRGFDVVYRLGAWVSPSLFRLSIIITLAHIVWAGVSPYNASRRFVLI